MKQDIPDALKNNINESVLSFIKDYSAHSDVADALVKAVAPLGDVQTFCPDASQYKYLIVSTKNIIFGITVGMNKTAFRLNPLFKHRAIKTGGMDYPEAGPEWVSFTLFRDDWPEFDLKFWARKAYVIARETYIDQETEGAG